MDDVMRPQGGIFTNNPPQEPSPDMPYVQPVDAPNPGTGSPVNPYIPNIEPSPAQNTVISPPPPARRPSGARKIIPILLVIVLLGLLGFGGWFVYGMIMKSKTITLTYWGLWEEDATLRTILTDFETTHPNIKVQYTKQSPRQYRERLQAAIERNEGPDVFRFHNTWVPMLRNELSPAPKSIITAEQFSRMFYPVATADLVGGQFVYGMPMMIDGLGLYYNEDLFATAGVTPPVTWEDVLNIVPKLTVRNENTIISSAIALGTTGNVEHFSDIVATMMMQNGALMTTPTGKQAEEALIFYKKFSTPADPVYTWNETMDNSVYAFASGKVAMILGPSWRAFDIKQISPKLRFKIIPIPQLPGNTVTWASYWVEGVSTKSKYPNEAWELVRYMAGKDVVTKFYAEASKTRLFGEPYALVELADTLKADSYVGAYIAQAQTAKSFPLVSRTFDNGINDKLIKYIEDAVNAVGQGTAPTAALDTAANGFQQVLEGYGLTSRTAPTTQ